MDFFKDVRKVVTPTSLDLSLDKYFDHRFQTDLANRFNNWKYFFTQKCIIKHTNNCRGDCLQLRKKGPKNVKRQWKSYP